MRLLSVIFTAGYLWSVLKGQCASQIQVICKLQSVNRFHNNNTHHLLKVQEDSTGNYDVAFVGEENEDNVTEFLLTGCRNPTGIGLDYTIQWNPRPSYTLAVKSSQVVLEATTSTSTHNLFHFRTYGPRRRGVFTLRSKSQKRYFLMGGNTGQLLLGRRNDRRTLMKFAFCK
ncbi:uncharacterized protein LOC141877112 [Acropora palmata]|uniref:uncharacterized protein LOC141877112 n=1 Tax=Acropora palmata TaxID=6131 RepID=UPI003DA1751A